MRQFLLIDPLEKLNIKKDSSLMLALSMQKKGIETYVFFEKDFSIHNLGAQSIKAYSFEGSFKEDGIYLEGFRLLAPNNCELNTNDLIHMRLDPPFDSHYLRVLWMLDHLHSQGIKVMNNPRGIMIFNEKLYAYRKDGAVASFVGEELSLAQGFVDKLPQDVTELILKPMDLFSGIGVEKVSRSSFQKRFEQKVIELHGPVIVQPFVKAVMKGEIRSIYFKSKEIGTILKVPKEGEFLSNIAQGASFGVHPLSDKARSRAESIVKELAQHGVDWVAFDILGDAVTEVNITCPGLLVEVSYAYKKNLADTIIEML